jgi:hypothetical protein
MAHDPHNEHIAVNPAVLVQARAGWDYIKSRYGHATAVDHHTWYHEYASGDVIHVDINVDTAAFHAQLDAARAQLPDNDATFRRAVLDAWADDDQHADCD